MYPKEIEIVEPFDILFSEPIISKHDMIALMVAVFLIVVFITSAMCVSWKSSIKTWILVEIIAICSLVVATWIVKPWTSCNQRYLYIRVNERVPISFFDDYNVVHDYGDGVYKIEELSK